MGTSTITQIISIGLSIIYSAVNKEQPRKYPMKTNLQWKHGNPNLGFWMLNGRTRFKTNLH
jgi:hypothetical protein